MSNKPLRSPSVGIIVSKCEGGYKFVYNLSQFPDVQKLLEQLREESDCPDLNWEETGIFICYPTTAVLG